MNRLRIALGGATLAALLTLTACGGDSGGSVDTATDTGSAPFGRPGGLDADQLEEIEDCLDAAGLEDKMPTGQPSGIPTDLPSDFPTDRPEGRPADPPTAYVSGGPGGGYGFFQDPEVQDALKACGIELPQPSDQD